MNLRHHPELAQRLAAAYALGTLRGGARRRFEAMAREQAPLRAAALVWQARLSAVAELQAPVAPDRALWVRIDNLVRADLARQAAQGAHVPGRAPAPGAAWWHSLLFWRAAALAAVLATALVLAVGLQQRDRLSTQLAAARTELAAAPRLEYVAVLADEAATAAVLVTYDPRQGQLTVKRLSGFREGPDQSLQLWALPPSAAPRSLGVIGGDAVLRLAAARGAMQDVPALAISLEPRGGVPGAGGPTGPVLFKGALVRAAL